MLGFCCALYQPQQQPVQKMLCQNHFAQLNRHILTFLHLMFFCNICTKGVEELVLLGRTLVPLPFLPPLLFANLGRALTSNSALAILCSWSGFWQFYLNDYELKSTTFLNWIKRLLAWWDQHLLMWCDKNMSILESYIHMTNGYKFHWEVCKLFMS